MSKKLDIIVPAYKAHGVLHRVLGSVIIQTIVDQVKVTIVNDADDKDYQDFVKTFSPFVEVEEIKMEKNGGPGVARQYGIDHTSLPYFTCIDADDCFSSPFSLQRLLIELEQDPTIVMNVGSFAEDHNNLTFLNHPNDMIWMFGKVYRRSFIKRYDIRFNDTRANEDNGFNTMIKLIASDQEKVNFIQDIVYYWMYKEDSITRVNNAEYSYNQSFPGYTTNMIYAVNGARKRKPFNPAIDQQAIVVMASLYYYYMQAEARDPRFLEQNYSSCLEYYDKVFKEVYTRIGREHVNALVSEVMVQQAPSMRGVVPSIDFYGFMDRLEKDLEKRKAETKETEIDNKKIDNVDGELKKKK